MESKTPTIYDVAEAAGVSIATVSRVLQNPSVVRPNTQERVMTAVHELAYVPSGSARTLAARRNSSLGLFLPGFDGGNATEVQSAHRTAIIDDIGGPRSPARPMTYFDQVLYGAELEASGEGFALMMAIGRGASQDKMLHSIAGRVDGLAVVASNFDDTVLERLARRLPLVLVAGAAHRLKLDRISVDNSGGMDALVTHLLATKKLTSVTFLAGPDDSADSAARLRGFKRAVARHTGAVEVTVTEAGEFSEERGRWAGRQLIDDGPLTDAVICANDQLALGFLDACAARGIAVPDDVIVSGFDGIDVSRMSTPRLTSVEQPMVELGREAMKVLSDRIADPGRPLVNRKLRVKIMLRESTEGPSAP